MGKYSLLIHFLSLFLEIVVFIVFIAIIKEFKPLGGGVLGASLKYYVKKYIPQRPN